MLTARAFLRRAEARDMLFFRNPHLWPQRPFLPVVRRFADEAEPELGIMYDAIGHEGVFGFSATVFLINLFFAQPAIKELLAGPRRVYDTFEELADDGWTVD